MQPATNRSKNTSSKHELTAHTVEGALLDEAGLRRQLQQQGYLYFPDWGGGGGLKDVVERVQSLRTPLKVVEPDKAEPVSSQAQQ